MAYDGTIVGAPTFAAGPAGFGNALQYDGSTQYVTVPNTAFNPGPNDSWTITARIKTNTTDQRLIFAQVDGSNNAIFYLAILGNNLQFHIASGWPGDVTSGVDIHDNAWHTLAVCCYEGVKLCAFVDGVPQSPITGQWAQVTPGTTWIGGWKSAGNYWLGSLQEVAIYQSAIYHYGANYTPAAAPLSATYGAQVALWRLGETTGATTAVDSNTASLTAILPSNAAIIQSPWNWLTVPSIGICSANPGAYIRTFFTGTLAWLRCSTLAQTGTLTGAPVVAWRIDGGVWQYASAAGIINLTPSALSDIRHYLEVVLSAQSFSTDDRWGSSSVRPLASLTITGLFTAAGKAVSAPPARAYNVLIYGDSITDGTKVLGNGGTDVQNDDAVRAWPLSLIALGSYEIGVVAFSGQAIDGTAHTSTVPAWKNTYNLLNALTGATRSFSSPAPAAVVYLLGKNDDTGPNLTAIAADLVAGAAAIKAAAPASKHLMCCTFDGTIKSTVQAAAATAGATFVDTTAWLPGFTSLDTPDGVHPYAAAQVGYIAPQMAAALRTVLTPPATSGNKGVLSRRGLGF